MTTIVGSLFSWLLLGLVVVVLLVLGVRLLRKVLVFVQDGVLTPIGHTYYRLTYPERARAAANNPHRNIDTTRLPPLDAPPSAKQTPKRTPTPAVYNPEPDPSEPHSSMEVERPSARVEFEAPPTEEERERAWDELILPERTKRELRLIESMLADPDMFERNWGRQLDFKGALLLGPPGTGKTTIAKALAKSVGFSFFQIDPAKVKAMWVGESEKVIAQLYKEARENAPSIIFLDEVDAYASQRSDSSSDRGGSVKAANSLVNQLLQEIDGFNSGDATVFTIAATNRADTLDAALRSRLNYNIEVPLPTPEARARIFDLNMGSYVKLGRISHEMRDALLERLEGMSGRDIKNLANAIPLITVAHGKENVDEEVIEEAFNRTRVGTPDEIHYR